MIPAFLNWSGGKDSSLTLYKVLQGKEFDIRYLLTSVNGHYGRISMHGVRVELLEKQAAAIGIPLKQLIMPEAPTMEEYEQLMYREVEAIKNQGIEHSVFGDIFLEDLKAYREQQLAKVAMKAVFPLWKQPTASLVQEFIDLGFKAVLVCVNEKYLDHSFAGRMIDNDLLKDLPKNVDPCGENGEYHSFVFDGPIFKEPVPFELGEVVHRTYGKRDDNEDNCGTNTTKADTGFFTRNLFSLLAILWILSAFEKPVRIFQLCCNYSSENKNPDRFDFGT